MPSHHPANFRTLTELAPSRLVDNKAFALSICLGMCISAIGNTQALPHSASAAAATRVEKQSPFPLTLHYDDPVMFPIGTSQSVIFGDFKCDNDGSVYVPEADPGPRDESTGLMFPSVTVIGLTPSGTVVRFAPRAVDGYRNVISLVRYYVSTSYVYLLVMGDKIDPSDNQNVLGRSRFIQVFKHNGEFVRTITLPPELDDPLNIAAFPSGDLLLFNISKLNHTTSLHLLDSSGDSESELKLFDSDFAGKLDGAGNNPGQSPAQNDSYKLLKVLSTVNVTARGDDLMLTARGENLPTVEINEHGIVRELSLALPAGTVLYGLLPTTDPMLYAIVGKSTSPPSGSASSSSDAHELQHGFLPTEIDEFYPQDGSLARRIKVEPGPMPACANNGTYTFVAPRAQDGKLQVLHATPAK
jgi:hypothetical protein